MLRLAMLGCAIFLLSSCTTFQDIETGLNQLTGKNINAAYYKLGYPSAVNQLGQDKSYIWTTRNTGSYTLPQTNYGTGYVGMTPYSYSYTSYQTQAYDYNCTIRIITGPDEIIKTWDYQGNVGGCGGYASRLKPAS